MEATEANKMSFGSIVQGHLQTMKIEILTEVDVKLSPIAERVAKLETEWKATGGGGGGGGGGGSSNASTYVPKNSEYKPKYLEIKGFVTNWNTNEGSLDEGEAHAYLSRLFANIPRGAELFNSQRSLAVTRGRLVRNKLLLYFSDAAVESKDMKRDALAVAKTFVEGNAPGGSANCSVAVEPPQYNNISNALMGKAKGVLLRHIEEPNLTNEWMSGTIYLKTPEYPRPVFLCSCYNGSWKVEETRMLAASNQELTKTHFLEEMAR